MQVVVGAILANNRAHINHGCFGLSVRPTIPRSYDNLYWKLPSSYMYYIFVISLKNPLEAIQFELNAR